MTNPEAPALRADAQAPHPWQPIESAPRDGTHVLGCRLGGNWRETVYWSDAQQGWYYTAISWVAHVTHWTPLPPVASASTGSAGDPTPHPKEGDFRTCRYCAEAHLEVFSERYGLKSDGWLHVETWVKLALLERSDLVAERDRLAHALAQEEAAAELWAEQRMDIVDALFGSHGEVWTHEHVLLKAKGLRQDSEFVDTLDGTKTPMREVYRTKLHEVTADRDRLAGGLVVLQQELQAEKAKYLARGDTQPDPLAPLPQPPSGEQ